MIITATTNTNSTVVQLSLALKPISSVSEAFDSLVTILKEHAGCKGPFGRKIHQWALESLQEYAKLTSTDASEDRIKAAATAKINRLAFDILVDPFYKRPFKRTISDGSWVWEEEVLKEYLESAQDTEYAGKSPFVISRTLTAKNLKESEAAFVDQMLDWIASLPINKEEREAKEEESTSAVTVRSNKRSASKELAFFTSRALQLQSIENAYAQTEQLNKMQQKLIKGLELSRQATAQQVEIQKRKLEGWTKEFKQEIETLKSTTATHIALAEQENKRIKAEQDETEAALDVAKIKMKQLEDAHCKQNITIQLLFQEIEKLRSRRRPKCVIM